MAVATQGRSTTSDEARRGAQTYLNSRLTNGLSKHQTLPFEVPVIDITPSFSDSLNERKAVAAKIRDACTNSGFFQITGHGISKEAQSNIISIAQRFFKDLPLDKKDALHVRHSHYFRGWENAEYTYVNPEDWANADSVPENKEGFNWGYEEGLDLTGGDGLYTELDGGKINGNVWPSEEDIPGFYATIREYYGAVLNLARHLFRLFALSLELSENHFDPMLSHPGGIARLMYYPPATNPQPLEVGRSDKEIGLGAHTDYECFTILLTSSPNGLEILSPENIWVPAPAVEDGLMINVADFLMRWTNGAYKSTVHRVVNRTREERYSVPCFCSINYDQMIETLPSCITPSNPSRYPPIRAGEYILERLKATAKDG